MYPPKQLDNPQQEWLDLPSQQVLGDACAPLVQLWSTLLCAQTRETPETYQGSLSLSLSQALTGELAFPSLLDHHAGLSLGLEFKNFAWGSSLGDFNLGTLAKEPELGT